MCKYLLWHIFMLYKIHLSEQTLGFTGYETDEELILLKNLGFKSN